jgi:hypothetical protein
MLLSYWNSWRSLGKRTSLSKDNNLAQSLGCEPGIDLQCVSRKPPKPERKSPAGRPVTNAYERMPRNRPTPPVTIEAVLYCVSERGLAALKEPANLERLSRCNAVARAQINERIAKLEKAL